MLYSRGCWPPRFWGLFDDPDRYLQRLLDARGEGRKAEAAVSEEAWRAIKRYRWGQRVRLSVIIATWSWRQTKAAILRVIKWKKERIKRWLASDVSVEQTHASLAEIVAKEGAAFKEPVDNTPDKV